MKYRALLTLDLEKGVSAEKREKFYEYLRDKKWAKLSDLTTTWKATFSEGTTREDAISTAKTHVANAAKHSNVSSYSAAVQVGEGLVEEF
ncbi:hypothetical protein [Vreelandella venusta]|uniref:hypothetical protein n=1 Tax=Vreelandella venusta TaxID=44935 RepID=UPI003C2FF7E3